MGGKEILYFSVQLRCAKRSRGRNQGSVVITLLHGSNLIPMLSNEIPRNLLSLGIRHHVG
jgi:hypothetical protein